MSEKQCPFQPITENVPLCNGTNIYDKSFDYGYRTETIGFETCIRKSCMAYDSKSCKCKRLS